MIELNVHIGEVRVAKNGETLKAILGSCVGVGFLWRAQSMYGLAHCLLPEAPTRSFEINGRFVDQAIASLVAMMKIREAEREEIEAVLAGGGNMTSPTHSDTEKLVGTNNSRVAERELKRLGIRILHRDLGGDVGRKISIDGRDGSFHIDRVPRLLK